MTGSGAEVQEERHVGIGGAQVAQELDGAVGQVRAEVVAVFDRSRRSHAVVVVVEGGRELVPLPAVEPVPAVEPPAERPRRARGGHVRLVVGAQVPFPDGVGRVAVGSEDLREEAVLPGRFAPVAGIARRQIGDTAHAAAVVVPAREEARTGGGAQRRGVEIGQPDPIGGHPVDDRSVHVGPVTAELREPHVIEDDQDDVRCAVGRCGDRRPPWLRRSPVVADLPPELDSGHRRPPRSRSLRAHVTRCQ